MSIAIVFVTGYYRDSDGFCTACHVAQYKPDMSDGPRSSCPPKTTTSTNSNSSDQCLCEAGYTPSSARARRVPQTAKHAGNQTRSLALITRRLQTPAITTYQAACAILATRAVRPGVPRVHKASGKQPSAQSPALLPSDKHAYNGIIQ